MTTRKIREKERENAAKKARDRKKQRRKRQLVTALVLIIVVSFITLGVLSLTVFFKTAKIDVKGSKTYTAEQIISAADIEIGDNLILINDKKTQEKLKYKLPFIDDVTIKRNFPDEVTISVKETKEEICFANDKGVYTSNKKGKIINKIDAIPDNLILVTVSDKVEFKTGKNVVFKNEREEELYNNFLSMIDTYNYEVNFINISNPFSSYLKLEDRLIVKFGSSSYFQNKSDYLKASLSGISKNAEGIYDLSAWTPDNNQPVLTYEDISSYTK